MSGAAAGGGGGGGGSGDGAAPRRIRFKCMFSTTIHDVLVARGWEETDSVEQADFIWADTAWVHEQGELKLADNQRLNHFQNHFELTRKDLLVKNIKRIRKSLEREASYEEASRYDFIPATFNLPSEYAMFVEEFRQYPGAVWIMKPVGAAQGKGIFLFNKLTQISDWKRDHAARAEGAQQQTESYIVQRYIASPYLIGGKKFDLRLYALVTSYAPLTVWLYRSGFARFTHHRYSMDLKEISNSFIHLTNVAVQRTAPTYDAAQGSKWPLRPLKQYLISRHGAEAVNTLFAEMQDVIVRSLLAVNKTMIADRHCFELYGYDLLIDETLRPWLLEVNASPSLKTDTPEDYRLKFVLLDDLLTVIDMERQLKGDETQIGGFDLICRQGRTFDRSAYVYESRLGAHNPRETQVDQLVARERAAVAASGPVAPAPASRPSTVLASLTAAAPPPPAPPPPPPAASRDPVLPVPPTRTGPAVAAAGRPAAPSAFARRGPLVSGAARQAFAELGPAEADGRRAGGGAGGGGGASALRLDEGELERLVADLDVPYRAPSGK